MILSNFFTALHSDTLLTGADFILGPNSPESKQTIVYNLSRGTTTVIANEMAEEWALNPITHQLAARFSSLRSASPETVGVGDSIKILSQELEDTTTVPTFNFSNNLPFGCNLVWSPDGNTLAFTVHANDDCRARVERVVFLDAKTGDTQEHVVPADSSIARIVPIGWVAV